MKHYKVVCAVVVHEGEVLCMQRKWQGHPSTAGKWEFPGGKVEDGETPEEALVRELREEMDYEVTILNPLGTVEHEYPDFSLSLQAFLCQASTRHFNCKEHIDYRWLILSELYTLDWAKADELLIAHIIELVQDKTNKL